LKILYLTSDSDGLGIAKRFLDEGNTVKVFLRNGSSAGDGLVDKVDSWRTELPDTDFVVSGSPEFAVYEDVFRQYGKPYIGGSKLGRLLTKGRRKEFLDHCGVTMCSNFEHKVMIHGFFNGRDWVKPLLISVVDTSLFPSDLGPEVGCMGSTMRVIKKWPDFVEQIGQGLRKLGVRDLISIPFDFEYQVLGVGCGFVYDIIEGIAEGVKEDLSDFLFRLANGLPESIDITTDYLVTVRLTVPPFPYPLGMEGPKIDIIGLDEHNLKHIFLSDVCFSGEGYKACTTSGNTMKVTARGRDLREAQRRVYRTLGNLTLQNKQYRIDIGDKAESILKDDSIRELVYV
jgi:hypothetical protein